MFLVALVQQQSEYIATHTDLKVGQYYGELNVDFWEKQKWIDEFENHQVLVFTAQVFLNVISHKHFGEISLSERIHSNFDCFRIFSVEQSESVDI